MMKVHQIMSVPRVLKGIEERLRAWKNLEERMEKANRKLGSKEEKFRFVAVGNHERCEESRTRPPRISTGVQAPVET